VILLLIKAISLLLDPIKVYAYNEITLREAHLSPLSLLVTMILVTMLANEIGLLIKDCWSMKPKRIYVKRLLTGYLSVMLGIFLLAVLANFYMFMSVFIPYLQGILICFGALYLFLLFRKNLEKLALLPTEVLGFIIHTYGGIPIIREPFSSKFNKTIALSSSLIATIVGLEEAISGKKIYGEIRTHHLIKITITMFFGKLTVGTFIASKDTAVLRDILRNIIETYERKVKYIDEGMVTDSDIRIAKEIMLEHINFIL